MTRPGGVFLVQLVRLKNADIVRNDIEIQRQSAIPPGGFHQLLPGFGARDDGIGSEIGFAVHAVRQTAGPGIGHRNIGGLADTVGTDLAAEGQTFQAFLAQPHIQIVKLSHRVAGFDTCRAGAAAPSVAEFGNRRPVDVAVLHKLAHSVRCHESTADHRQPVLHQLVDSRVVPRIVAQRVDVAGFADEGEGPVAIQRVLHVGQRGGLPVARSRAGDDVLAGEAQMAFAKRGFLGSGPGMQNEIDPAAFQEVDAKRRQHTAGRPLMADFRVGGPGHHHSPPGAPDIV